MKQRVSYKLVVAVVLLVGFSAVLLRYSHVLGSQHRSAGGSYLHVGSSAWFASTFLTLPTTKDGGWQELLEFIASVTHASSPTLPLGAVNLNAVCAHSIKCSIHVLKPHKGKENKRVRAILEELELSGRTIRRTDITRCESEACEYDSLLDALHWSKADGTDMLISDCFANNSLSVEPFLELKPAVSLAIVAIRFDMEDVENEYPRTWLKLFHRLYFLYGYVPIQQNSDCLTNKGKCELAILWQAKVDPDGYIPPAPGGSLKNEVERLNAYFESPMETACQLSQMVGVPKAYYLGRFHIDGSYVICLSHLLKPCLVYSFGIRNEWSFDDSMRNLSCEVKSFDPTMTAKAHMRAEKHWFYDWGLPQVGHPAYENKLKTLKWIRKTLNDTDRPISLLKFDVEGAERDFLAPALRNGEFDDIGQVVFEIHSFHRGAVNKTAGIGQTTPEEIREISYLIHLLERYGFTLYNVRRTPYGDDLRRLVTDPYVNFYYELSFLRLELF